MSDRVLTRRSVISVLGGGVALAVAGKASAEAAATMLADDTQTTRATRTAPIVESSARPTHLLSPIGVGTRVAGCAIEAISPVSAGAVTITLVDPSGVRFGVEVCARDGASNVRAPGETDRFQCFVINEGTGATPTDECHGVAAMAIAAVLARNEHQLEATGFLTLRERLERHAANVVRPA